MGGATVSHQDWGWAAVLLGAATLGLGLAWMGHGGAEPLVVLLGGCAVWCYLQWENTA